MSSDRLCFKLGLAARKLQKYYNHQYSALGITAAQSLVLFSLLRKDGQNFKDIAEEVKLDSSAITGLVDRLEKIELVRRGVDPNDRRAICIYLTNQGRDIAERAIKIADKTNQKLRSRGNKEQQAFLENFLDNIGELLG
ncbi:MAG: MarR family winged helix-turn-helix transcriptional regulator [Syntrophomonadaceae bacterium]|jgi:DNA-binding MarR family transcriptional regulator